MSEENRNSVIFSLAEVVVCVEPRDGDHFSWCRIGRNEVYINGFPTSIVLKKERDDVSGLHYPLSVCVAFLLADGELWRSVFPDADLWTNVSPGAVWPTLPNNVIADLSYIISHTPFVCLHLAGTSRRDGGYLSWRSVCDRRRGKWNLDPNE